MSINNFILNKTDCSLSKHGSLVIMGTVLSDKITHIFTLVSISGSRIAMADSKDAAVVLKVHMSHRNSLVKLFFNSFWTTTELHDSVGKAISAFRAS